ncbi:hypothetical protein J6590_042722 [Homalodisca vitripennis]|nr:hypothetical protein J6590_042722 [Homalodisca vitripennis]
MIQGQVDTGQRHSKREDAYKREQEWRGNLSILSNHACARGEGIMPYNPDIFKGEDFLTSFVTDRQLSTTQEDQQPSTFKEVHQSSTSSEVNPPTTSGSVQHSSTPVLADITEKESSVGISGLRAISPIVTAKQIRPLPNAGERKTSGKGKQPLRSCNLTDTSIKNKI